MRNKLKALWLKIPNAVRSGITTAVVTFVSGVLGILSGLVPMVSQVIGDFLVDGRVTLEPYLESLSAAKAAAISLTTALSTGVGNVIFRTFKPITAAYPKEAERQRQIVAAENPDR